MEKVKAVFLDRDGVLIEEKEYLADPDGVALLPGVVDGLLRLQAAGYLLVIVTNQAGVARGYFDEAAVHAVNERLCGMLQEKGVTIHAVYYSPYHPEGTVPEFRKVSSCRKPAPGMILQAASEWSIALDQSYLIGDKASDLGAAKAAGVEGLLVLTGYGATTAAADSTVTPYANFSEAAAHILA